MFCIQRRCRRDIWYIKESFSEEWESKSSTISQFSFAEMKDASYHIVMPFLPPHVSSSFAMILSFFMTSSIPAKVDVSSFSRRRWPDFLSWKRNFLPLPPLWRRFSLTNWMNPCRYERRTVTRAASTSSSYWERIKDSMTKRNDVWSQNDRESLKTSKCLFSSFSPWINVNE